MIICTSDGKSIDTETDLSAAERHILQKLLAWQSLVKTMPEFQKKRANAFAAGWNKSGPVAERPAMKTIIDDMEKKLLSRLNKKAGIRKHMEND
jgi:hypothetical protein